MLYNCKKYDLTRSKKWIHLAIDLILRRPCFASERMEEIESMRGEQINIHINSKYKPKIKIEDRKKVYER